MRTYRWGSGRPSASAGASQESQKRPCCSLSLESYCFYRGLRSHLGGEFWQSALVRRHIVWVIYQSLCQRSLYWILVSWHCSRGVIINNVQICFLLVNTWVTTVDILSLPSAEIKKYISTKTVSSSTRASHNFGTSVVHKLTLVVLINEPWSDNNLTR